MAKARTAVTMADQGWRLSLEIPNPHQATSGGNEAICRRIGMESLGLYVLITNGLNESGMGPFVEYGPPHEHASAPDEAGNDWHGLYAVYYIVMRSGEPEPLGALLVGQWLCDYWGIEAHSYDPAMTPTAYADLSCAITYDLSGVYAKGEVVGTYVPPTRAHMDYTDDQGQYAWYADEATTAVVSAVCLGNTISGNVAIAGAGDELEIGTTWGARIWWEINEYPGTNQSYAQVSNMAWGALEADLANLDLYYSVSPNPNNVPDSTQGHWSRSVSDADATMIRVADSGGIATWRESSSGTSPTGVTWEGRVALPYQITICDAIGQFSDAADYAGMELVGSPLEWVDSGGTWTSQRKTVYVGDSIVEQQKSWEFEHEWRKLDLTGGFYLEQRSAWRSSVGEDVGGSNARYNDERCGILLQRLTATTMTGDPHWAGWMTIGHLTSLNLNDPPGALSRPSQWVGYDGLVANDINSDLWTVATGSESPRVTRTIASRYPLRMARLSDHQNDPTNQHYVDWPIISKANVDLTAVDEAAWWSSAQGGCDYEDVRDLSSWWYLRIGITSPVAGTIRLRLYYDWWDITDPCYTCFEHRYGSEGEFEAAAVRRPSLSYDVPVVVGANSVLVDLRSNRELIDPINTQAIKHLVEWEMVLPSNVSGADHNWQLTELSAVLDPGQTGRAEPSWHVLLRSVRNWAFCEPTGTNEDWFGVGAIVDGGPGLTLNYGWDRTRYELGMLYIQRAQHCPLNSIQDRIDTAKALSRLATELNWQEGWTATYNSPEETASNKDADGNYLKAQFNWWDLRQAHEWSGTSIACDGAVCVGSVIPLAGIPWDMYVTVYPRGKVAGIARNRRTGRRLRNARRVSVYRRLVGATEWEPIWGGAADEHGFYASAPLLEAHYEYQVSGSQAVTGVANREYSHEIATIGGKWVALEHLFGTGRYRAWGGGDGNLTVELAGRSDVLDDAEEYTSPNLFRLGSRGEAVLVCGHGSDVELLVNEGVTWELATTIRANRTHTCACNLLPTNDLYVIGLADGKAYGQRVYYQGTSWETGTESLVYSDVLASDCEVRQSPSGLLEFLFHNSAEELTMVTSADNGETWT